jgi:glycosyltransferase involved in cell wall biosynthesis
VRILYHHRTQAEDGQAVHIRSLQDAFRSLGHEVEEVSLVSRAEGRPQTDKASTSRWRVVARAPRALRELAEYAYSGVARPKLVRAGRAHPADLLYERYAFGNTAGVSAARRLKIPLVLEVNSPMVLELGRTRGLSWPRLARRVETWIFTNADLVCVVTGVLRELLIEEGLDPARVIVTPNGVDLERYAHPDRAAARSALGLPPAEGGLVLGFVGYYRDWHRLDLAIEALASAELRSAQLVLVGEGPAHEALVRAARASGVEERVHFAGARRHDRIPALLPALDVALVPAINTYASPLKLIEYMAAGLAVIAPDQPNLREVLADGENGLLFPVGDGPALRSRLEQLAADPALRRRLGERARATVVERDLTWRANAQRVLAAVEPLLARS